MNSWANRNSERFQFAQRGSNHPIGQTVTRDIVKPDDQDPRMMANSRNDQVMHVFQALRISSQNWETYGDRLDQQPRIRDRQHRTSLDRTELGR